MTAAPLVTQQAPSTKYCEPFFNSFFQHGHHPSCILASKLLQACFFGPYKSQSQSQSHVHRRLMLHPARSHPNHFTRASLCAVRIQITLHVHCHSAQLASHILPESMAALSFCAHACLQRASACITPPTARFHLSTCCLPCAAERQGMILMNLLRTKHQPNSTSMQQVARHRSAATWLGVRLNDAEDHAARSFQPHSHCMHPNHRRLPWRTFPV
jgi:hypothetical protein